MPTAKKRYHRRLMAPREPRQQVLAEWRGIDLTPLEVARNSNTQSAEKLVPKVLAGMRVDERRNDVEVVKVWNHLIDPNITAHAQPVNLHKGTLFVRVDNNVWLSEIVRYKRKEILERLQHSFGRDTIKKISFRVG